jgi:flagellar protein FliL
MLIHSLMVVLVLTAGYWFLGCQSGKASASESKTSAFSTLHLEEFVVNLADRDGRSYLRIGIDLAVEGEAPKAKSEQHSAMVPVVRDSVIILLSAQKSDDLLTPDGKAKLKQDLIKTLNDRLPELKVRKIYFNDFMVQR